MKLFVKNNWLIIPSVGEYPVSQVNWNETTSGKLTIAHKYLLQNSTAKNIVFGIEPNSIINELGELYGDINDVMDYLSKAERIIIPVVKRMTSTLDFDSTVVKEFPNLNFEVIEGRQYWFEAILDLTRMSATPDFKIGYNAPIGTIETANVASIENAVVKKSSPNTVSASIAAATSTNNSSDYLIVSAVITAGSDGTIQITGSNNSGTTLQTFSTNSYIRFQEII